MYVMPDSNTLVSATAFPDSFLQKVIRCAMDRHTLVVSTYVLGETKNTIHRKFPHRIDAMSEFFATAKYVNFLLPDDWDDIVDVPYIRDPKDREVLASAILSCSDILITGDKDFAGISIPNLMIMTPRAFLEWEAAFTPT